MFSDKEISLLFFSMVVLMAVGEIAKGIVYTDSIKTGYVHVNYTWRTLFVLPNNITKKEIFCLIISLCVYYNVAHLLGKHLTPC